MCFYSLLLLVKWAIGAEMMVLFTKYTKLILILNINLALADTQQLDIC